MPIPVSPEAATSGTATSGTATSGTATSGATTSARPFRRKHALMLLLAVEVMAYGAWQADQHRDRPYTLIEIPATPNHVVT